MSGSKRKNEKVDIGMDVEDMEDDGNKKKVANEPHSKKYPKRKKGKIEHENVNIKNMEDKVRKLSKEHPEGLRRLATRMTPGMLLYVYNTKFSGVKIMKRLPFVKHVTSDVLGKIEKLEICVGGFGRKLQENFKNVDVDDEMMDEAKLLDVLKKDYWDEDVRHKV
ncbi:unnamed protein product [Lactuca saligna]|uniref:Uncharacterized protein n=1 Tax=Lactuca saligna TaxID=75948 RepID=A0AA35YX20_LACSI|nr:unnamed protein product [Lactuca saligna]